MPTKLFKPNLKNFAVLTPDGFKPFAGVSLMGHKPTIKLEFENGVWIECTPDHALYISDTVKKAASDFEPGVDTVLTTSGNLLLLKKSQLSDPVPVYDLIDVQDKHRFYANGILSSNCEFLVYEETLISATLLSQLLPVDPQFKQGQVRWFQAPKRGHTYVVALDPSLGTGGDNAAIEIFELPTCVQVGEWQHNKTTIPHQIRILKEICQYIADTIGTDSDIYYSVENNSIGEACLISIAEVGEDNIRGSFLSEPSKVGQSKKFRKGFTTTHSSKLTACAKLKNMLETGKMKICSKNLLSELKTFVASGSSFAAKSGETDDLVMALILVIRIITVLQNYDPELDNKLRSNVDDAFQEPLPFIMLR